MPSPLKSTLNKEVLPSKISKSKKLEDIEIEEKAEETIEQTMEPPPLEVEKKNKNKKKQNNKTKKKKNKTKQTKNKTECETDYNENDSNKTNTSNPLHSVVCNTLYFHRFFLIWFKCNKKQKM